MRTDKRPRQRDGKLYVRMGPLTVELGEVYEV
jgi:hypothetical protein